MLERSYNLSQSSHEHTWQAQEKDENLKMELQKKYNKMIDDLNNDRVAFNAYQKFEKWELPEKDMADLQKSKSMNALWNGKYNLAKARKSAGVRQKRYSALEGITGEKVRDESHMLQIEKTLTLDQQRRLLQELFTDPPKTGAGPKETAETLAETQEKTEETNPEVESDQPIKIE